MPLRVICRSIVLDQETAKILLVRNANARFWYLPGGGWEADSESIEECIVREVREETGINVHPVRLMYVQEFRPDNDDIHLELFWFCYPTGSTTLGEVKDLHGIVEEARWFSREDMAPHAIFPKRLKNQFWHELASAISTPNPFLK